MSTEISRQWAENYGWKLTPKERKSAIEHLKSVGYDVDRMPRLVWPDNAVTAYQSYPHSPWEFKYKSDILRRKREEMGHCLWRKREYGVVRRVPLYVWVFWCPGIGGNSLLGGIFSGWWLYLKGLNFSQALDFRSYEKRLIEQITKLFPLVELTLFGPSDLEEWKSEFVKRYPCGKWCGKPQGKAPIWAKIENGNVKRILCRAKCLAKASAV